MKHQRYKPQGYYTLARHYKIISDQKNYLFAVLIRYYDKVETAIGVMNSVHFVNRLSKSTFTLNLENSCNLIRFSRLCD